MPIIGKILTILIIVMASIIAFFLTGCGITQSTINNIDSDGASHSMTVNPSQSSNTSVTTDANVQIP